MKNRPPVNGNMTECEERAMFFEAFFNSNVHYQLLLNNELEIVAFNECALAFHQTYNQLVLKKGCSILEYINPALLADFKHQCKVALQGEPVAYEHFMNGAWFDFVISGLYNTGKSVIGLSIVGFEVNSRKKMEKLLRQQTEHLSKIAWFQSHQVRHPVSSILGLVDMMKGERDHDVQKEYLQHLEKATQQLDQIIRAIVTESRAV